MSVSKKDLQRTASDIAQNEINQSACAAKNRHHKIEIGEGKRKIADSCAVLELPGSAGVQVAVEVPAQACLVVKVGCREKKEGAKQDRPVAAAPLLIDVHATP